MSVHFVHDWNLMSRVFYIANCQQEEYTSRPLTRPKQVLNRSTKLKDRFSYHFFPQKRTFPSYTNFQGDNTK